MQNFLKTLTLSPYLSSTAVAILAGRKFNKAYKFIRLCAWALTLTCWEIEQNLGLKVTLPTLMQYLKIKT